VSMFLVDVLVVVGELEGLAGAKKPGFGGLEADAKPAGDLFDGEAVFVFPEDDGLVLGGKFDDGGVKSLGGLVGGVEGFGVDLIDERNVLDGFFGVEPPKVVGDFVAGDGDQESPEAGAEGKQGEGIEEA